MQCTDVTYAGNVFLFKNPYWLHMQSCVLCNMWEKNEEHICLPHDLPESHIVGFCRI